MIDRADDARRLAMHQFSDLIAEDDAIGAEETP